MSKIGRALVGSVLPLLPAVLLAIACASCASARTSAQEPLRSDPDFVGFIVQTERGNEEGITGPVVVEPAQGQGDGQRALSASQIEQPRSQLGAEQRDDGLDLRRA